jgi:hypothetical protein
MTSSRDIIYKIAYSELKAGEEAKETGNIGQARVCARRACGMAIEHWLENNPKKNWGASAMSILTKMQEDHTIPKDIRDAAERLTKRVDQNFETGIEEDPLKDGEIIIEYFLDPKNLKK